MVTQRLAVIGFGRIGRACCEGWDLVSCLAFDRAYTRRVLDLGRADAHANADVIRAHLDQTSARRAC